MANKNEIKVNITTKPNCQVQLDVEVNAEIVKEAKKQALKEIKKNITVAGFRKGKAPDEIIIKNYAQALKEKWEKKIADLSFMEAHKSKKIPEINPGSKIVFNLKEYSIDTFAKIDFSYETIPEVPEIDPSLFKLKNQKKADISEKEINEAIRQIRFFHAKWEEVKRPIKQGDYVIIDLESLETDPPQKVFSDTRFEVSQKGMANWMQEILIGANINDVLEAVSKPDESASEKEKKEFEPKKVRVTVKKIEKATLPKLDDEFAKKVGSQSVEEMKDSIKSMLLNQLKARHNEENRKQVNDFLLNTYKFEVPSSLIQSEFNYRKNTYLQNPKNKKAFDAMPAKDKEALEKKLLTLAENAIKIFYISKKIVNDFKIKISEDEIKQEALNIMYKELGKKADPNNIPKDIYALVLSKLVLIKAEDFILDQQRLNSEEKSHDTQKK